MKGLAFLVFLIIVFVLIYKGVLSLEPLVIGSMKYYKFIIIGFLAFLLLVNPDVIKKMYSGRKRALKKEDLVEEYNFVNHVRKLTENVSAKNQNFINEKIKFILGGQGGKCNNCSASISVFQGKLDLKKPISLGGDTENHNLQVLCMSCYNEKQSINNFLK
tara:strand:- start:11 stop:493 length:483 start_codon:yes stop_codon:yes gene_type:complete